LHRLKFLDASQDALYAFLRITDGFQKPCGIRGRTQEVGGFLQRLIVCQRHQHTIPPLRSGNEQGSAVFHDSVHCVRKLLPRIAVIQGSHDMVIPIVLYWLLYSIQTMIFAVFLIPDPCYHPAFFILESMLR
jgi:hypothetical protein